MCKKKQDILITINNKLNKKSRHIFCGCYEDYFDKGDKPLSGIDDYSSNNTKILNKNEVIYEKTPDNRGTYWVKEIQI